MIETEGSMERFWLYHPTRYGRGVVLAEKEAEILRTSGEKVKGPYVLATDVIASIKRVHPPNASVPVADRLEREISEAEELDG